MSHFPAQVITDLQASVHAAREDSRQLRQEAEQQRQEAESRWEAERQMLTRNADINSKVGIHCYATVVFKPFSFLQTTLESLWYTMGYL